MAAAAAAAKLPREEGKLELLYSGEFPFLLLLVIFSQGKNYSSTVLHTTWKSSVFSVKLDYFLRNLFRISMKFLFFKEDRRAYLFYFKTGLLTEANSSFGT
jgi:hypothetical protein